MRRAAWAVTSVEWPDHWGYADSHELIVRIHDRGGQAMCAGWKLLVHGAPN